MEEREKENGQVNKKKKKKTVGFSWVEGNMLAIKWSLH